MLIPLRSSLAVGMLEWRQACLSIVATATTTYMWPMLLIGGYDVRIYRNSFAIDEGRTTDVREEEERIFY